METRFETLAFGFGLAEAPRWDEGGVCFTDVLGGGIYRWTPFGVETLLEKRRGVGGLALCRNGDLVASGRDVIRIRDGETQPLLQAPDDVTGFNDMTVDAAGRIYVGALRFRALGGEESVPGDVWRIDPDGSAEHLFRGIHWPNGIGVSLGGETLYCCDYATGAVIAHDLDDEGRASGWRLLASSPSGQADGLAVDGEGAVWVATGSGASIARLAPDGSLIAIIEVPAPFVSALCFGGDDLTDLYITTMGGDRGGSLLRTSAPVTGSAVARYAG